MTFRGDFATKLIPTINLEGDVVLAATAGTTGNINVFMRDKDYMILYATGTDVPDDTSSGYAKGCLFIDTDVAAGTSAMYENVGTTTSCDFNGVNIGAVAEGDITLANTKVVIGSAGGVGAAFALSGDVTMTAGGAVTIATVGGLATAAEINRTCDNSTRIVTIVETGAITQALHDGKTCMLGEVGGNALVTLTLPEATGSGARFKFIVSVVNTSTYVIVTADTTNADLMGNVINQDADLVGTIGALTYLAGATDDTITLDGAGKGGQLGDWIELIDVATDLWAVNGVVSCPAGSNTSSCFSAA